MAKSKNSLLKLEDSPIDPGKKLKHCKKQKRDGLLRKAPQAPRRFKSSYILFFMAKQDEIKQSLPPGSSVGDVSKKSSQLWKTLSAEERAYWDEKGEQDKQRYLREKNAYTGPWQVPYKRAKKNPLAPKRPMSSFLFFSKARRKSIKDEHPNMKNTEISSILGEQWRNASEEERRPHIEKELQERSKYKAAVEEFKREEVARKEEQRKAAARIAATADTQRQQTNTMVTSVQNHDMSYRFVQHNTTHNIPDSNMHPTSHISLTNSQFYDPATSHRAPWNIRQGSSQNIFKVDSNESGCEFNDNLFSFLDHDGHTSVTDF